MENQEKDFLEAVYGIPVYFDKMSVDELKEYAHRCHILAQTIWTNSRSTEYETNMCRRLNLFAEKYALRIAELEGFELKIN